MTRAKTKGAPKDAPKPGSEPLANSRHEEFVLHYIATRNMARSYAMAGYADSNGGRVMACRLARRPEVAARIAFLLGQRFKALQMDADEILARTAQIARADVRQVFDDKGALLKVTEMDEDAAAAVAGIETIEEFSGTGKDRVKIGDVRKVRLRDPMPALRLLAEYKKLVKTPDDGANALANALADRLKAARERRKERTQ